MSPDTMSTHVAMGDLSTLISSIEPERGLLVGGTWSRGRGGRFGVEDPACGGLLADVCDATPTDAADAAHAAAECLPDWSAAAPRVRSELLSRARDLMLRDADALAALISAENGKSLADARAEVVYAAEFFRWYAEEAVRPAGDYGASPAGGTRTVVTHRPVGVAALVTPWNFPAAMATRKIAPALAAGCTVVLKPAPETPLTALALARLLAEAGVPAGVVNVVPTTRSAEVVSTLLEHPAVRKISFTGSTGVGRQLLRQAAEQVVNTSMELGGCAPFIVTDSADLEKAVTGAMIAKFRNGGQACTAANAFFVHERLADDFIGRLGRQVEDLSVGPAVDGNDIGPLISSRALGTLRGRLAEAVEAGGTITYRASAEAENTSGHFLAPVVVEGLGVEAPLVSEEIFGPVAPVVRFDDIETLVDRLNRQESGLAGYVYGELSTALHLAERLEIAMVGINRGLVSDPAAPFGGVKHSGIGREGARAGIEEYLEPQYFSVAW